MFARNIVFFKLIKTESKFWTNDKIDDYVNN